MSISAMKQALDLLETSWGCGHQETLDRWNETIEVLYEAIEQAEKRDWAMQQMVTENQRLGLYDPPKRKWVGLTDEEMREARRESKISKTYTVDIPRRCKGGIMTVHPVFEYIEHFAELIEAKLKEKNCSAANNS